MSYQVGDNAQFRVETVSAEGTNVYSYVWTFWDASVQVGTTGTTYKNINIGGDPLNGNQLIYQCSPVMSNGSSTNLYGTIVANNPPYVAASPSISVNDDYYGYTTKLSVRAYTIDGHNPITFGWYQGGNYLGAGVNGAVSAVDHTWVGNGTSISGVYVAQENSLTLRVDYDQVITFKGTDTAMGITTVDFRLRGKTVPPLGGVLVADGNSVTTDATSQPVQRIGPGQTVTFVAYVTDIDGLMPSFTWSFPAAPPGNWTVTSFTGPTNATLPDGSFSSTIVKDVSAEVVATSDGSVKICVASCLITGNPSSRSAGQTATLQFTVQLVKNQSPTSTTITCVNQSNNATVNMATDTVAIGTKLIYSAATTDPENDVVHQAWTVDNYPYPNPLYAYGPKIVIDTTGYTPGQRPSGLITSTDRMGASISLAWSGPNLA